RPRREGGAETLGVVELDDPRLAAREQLQRALLGLPRGWLLRADEPGAAELLTADRGHVRDGPFLADGPPERRHELGVEGLDEDVDGAAAGEPDLEGLLVGDPVRLQPRRAAGEHLASLLVDGRLDAAACDR